MISACWAQMGAALHTVWVDMDRPAWWVLPALVVLAGLLGALLLAPVLQWAYVRRVQRYMGFREVQPPPRAW
ncbi:MAG: hypothetical protein ACR2JA_18715, partial [Hydrogenophaga sp.]